MEIDGSHEFRKKNKCGGQLFSIVVILETGVLISYYMGSF